MLHVMYMLTALEIILKFGFSMALVATETQLLDKYLLRSKVA
jgi:hypothetical protein